MGPLLRAMGRRPAAVILVIFEVAFGLVIVVHGLMLIRLFHDVPRRDTRISEEVFTLDAQLEVADVSADALGRLRARDLAALRALPELRAVAVAHYIPQTRRIGLLVVSADSVRVIAYLVDGIGMTEVLGVNIEAGRALFDGEVDAVVLTHDLAVRLFGAPAKAIGRQVELRGQPNPMHVVGVCETFFAITQFALHPSHAVLTSSPVPLGRGMHYAVRAAPGAGVSAREAALATLAAVEPGRIISYASLQDQRREVEESANGGRLVFTVMVVAMVLLALLGSLAMSSFLVAERIRQIGTRRALGARRGDIARYFLVESGIVTTLGLIAGLPLTAGVHQLTRLVYPELHLDAGSVLRGCALFWLAGLAAALVPALRAAAVPPSAASRTQ